MPAKSSDQRKLAAIELRKRRQGAKRQKKQTRPFGTATLKELRDFAKSGRTSPKR